MNNASIKTEYRYIGQKTERKYLSHFLIKLLEFLGKFLDIYLVQSHENALGHISIFLILNTKTISVVQGFLNNLEVIIFNDFHP
jgi:hypothetical protein